ncbi:hypothetical protein N431DRAFT_185477 [Stipitochalara longipes BDJ]|nr:hypothetical protein N431DRAFT_185477 [Stipitochalara longipes BDJ]
MAFRAHRRLEISAAYSHRSYLQLPGHGMAFLMFLLLYCSYWHSFGPPLPKSPSIRYHQAECFFGLWPACMLRSWVSKTLASAYSATRYLGHGMVALHEIEKGHKSAALYHNIAKRQQVFYKTYIVFQNWCFGAGVREVQCLTV